jgi:SsrA-binding protein
MSKRPARKAPKQKNQDKLNSARVFASNRRASFNYEILETYEAGIVLQGTEIKSVRLGSVSLQGAYAYTDQDEIWLYNMHIPPYAQAGPRNHEPIRPRKLLLHRRQLDELIVQVQRKGLAVVPLRLYLKGHLIKVALGVGRGKRQYQKKQAIINREVDREIRRTLKES